jgi:hypothetical protein
MFINTRENKRMTDYFIRKSDSVPSSTSMAVERKNIAFCGGRFILLQSIWSVFCEGSVCMRMRMCAFADNILIL